MARISQDREANLLGVPDRRLHRGRSPARGPGGEVYVDDDVRHTAASTGPQLPAKNARGHQGQRPAHARGHQDSRIDAVVVWNLDRLHRHPKELEEFFEVVATAGVSQLASVSGDVDLSTGEGQFLRTHPRAVARKESDDKSRRAKRKAPRARPGGDGGREVHGPLATTPRCAYVPEEAAVIREMAGRLLSGSHCARSSRICRRARSRRCEVDPGACRRCATILKRPALAGFGACAVRCHPRGVGADPERGGERPSPRAARRPEPPPHPSGTYVPSRDSCIARLRHEARVPAQPWSADVCLRRRNGLRGCGGVSIVGEPLEEFVTDAVLFRLDNPASRKR